MAHTHNQYCEQRLTTLEKDNEKNQIDISSISSSISNINSYLALLESLPTSITQLTSMCQQSQDAVKNLISFSIPTLDPLSSSTPYTLEDHESSQSKSFPFHLFHRDLHSPHVDVKNFDGSDPTRWVTQMENYFYLYKIIDDLAKLMVWCSPSRSKTLAMVAMEKKCQPRVFVLDAIC
jgi:hypothetical protein